MKKIADLSPLHAASGLVKQQDRFYVVADDEFSLAEVSLTTGKILLHKLLKTDLPQDFNQRKKLKADWESLVEIPPITGSPGLLVLPSGSTLQRQTGFWVPGQDPASGHQVDFSGVFAKLRETLVELNIEGGAIWKDSLCLLQRGNGSLGENALIRLDLAGVLSDLLKGAAISSMHILQIERISLILVKNLELGFTDACVCDGHLFFLAVGEEGHSTYHDGEYKGAVLGCISDDYQAILIERLEDITKPEGLWIEKSAGKYTAFIVTDADDRSQSSTLFEHVFSFPEQAAQTPNG